MRNRLTERDLSRIVKRIINEEDCSAPPEWLMNFKLDGKKGTSDCSNWNWRVSSNLFVWISLKDKMLSLTTELELDETSKKTISSAMGTQPKTKSTTLYWSKTFMSSEAGGDLNRTLNGLQGQIPWMSSLNESYLNRIVKRVVNESPQSLDGVKDDLRQVTQRLMRSMDEYNTLMRKGEYKRMGDELDNIRRMVRRLKDVTQQIESKI